jgi:ribosome maturation protein SDO1
MAGITHDKERLHLNLARLQKGSLTFEVVVDPDLAIAYSKGEEADISDVLKSDEVFTDAKKGMVASEQFMEQALGTTDPVEAAKKILREGKVQVTAEYREKLREEKRKWLIDMIQSKGVDPKTNLPHPPTRIENAFREANIRVDEYSTAEDQVQGVLKQLRTVLPIKFVIKEVAVKIPADYAAKSYSIVKAFGAIVREDWQSDGSWVVVLEIPGGMESEFYEKLNSLTHGTVETKVLTTK